jgi:hypothetical protein
LAEHSASWGTDSPIFQPSSHPTFHIFKVGGQRAKTLGIQYLRWLGLGFPDHCHHPTGVERWVGESRGGGLVFFFMGIVFSEIFRRTIRSEKDWVGDKDEANLSKDQNP